MKIMFVCLGNICRSPMAEFIMKDLVKKHHLNIHVSSSGTSGYHNGENAHYGTLNELKKHHIDCSGFKSSKLSKQDGYTYDYIVAMDQSNMANILKILPNDYTCKVIKLLNEDVPDPWYDGNFERTYNMCLKGCIQLLKELDFNI